MKHQSVKDRLHEGEGMVRHPMSEYHGSAHEHVRMEHDRHMSGRHAAYKHEVDMPEVPPHGHQEAGMGCHEFKDQAQDIAYGQAGVQGCKSDAKKMSSQFKNYHWDSDTGGASGY